MSRDLVVALSGGIGGAKLALGLSRIVEPRNLVVVANVGDDFEHLGLHISPDFDTSDVHARRPRQREARMGQARRDVVVHGDARRARRRGLVPPWRPGPCRSCRAHAPTKAGETLSAVTADFCRRLGVGPRVLPATDDRLRTRLRTDDGWLDFQDYFVRLQCRPAVRELAFAGAEEARAHPELLAALGDERLRAVVICPSNPFISVEPILAVKGMRQALSACAAPVVAVSPIIGGRAVKGPTAKMMVELGMTPSAAAVAQRYGELIDGYVMDVEDAAEAAQAAARVTLARTLMTNLEEREQLARVVLEAADAIFSSKRGRDLVA